MISLFKYELRRRWKMVSLVAIVMTIVNLYMTLRTSAEASIEYVILVYGLSGFAVFVLLVIDIINIMKQDLYGDTGYLMMSIPKKGRQILGAKTLMAVVEFITWIVLMVILGWINVTKFIPLKEMEIVKSQILANRWDIYYIAMTILISFILFILMVYFSMAIARTIWSNKRFGKTIAFGIFIGLNLIYERIFLNLIGWKDIDLFVDSNNTVVISNEFSATVMIVFVVTVIGFFAATSYLLENKVNI